MLAAPLAAVVSAARTFLIPVLFVPRALWSARVEAAPDPGPMSRRQRRILWLLLALVGLWLTETVHGLGMALVATLGAVILSTPPFTERRSKELFQGVDLELILYMAATMMIAQSMTDTGADRWLADGVLAVVPEDLLAHDFGVAAALSILAVTAHLAIASRSIRAAVLVPAVAFPLAGMDHDVTLMVLIAVLGTGFCQTLRSSANRLRSPAPVKKRVSLPRTCCASLYLWAW